MSVECSTPASPSENIRINRYVWVDVDVDDRQQGEHYIDMAQLCGRQRQWWLQMVIYNENIGVWHTTTEQNGPNTQSHNHHHRRCHIYFLIWTVIAGRRCWFWRGRHQKPNMNGNSARNSVDRMLMCFSVIHFKMVYIPAVIHGIFRLWIAPAIAMFMRELSFRTILMKICHLCWAINPPTATFSINRMAEQLNH